MASGGPVGELCEEATCSICLDFFTDPVMIPECGHSFCRACLDSCWGASREEPSCPQCRGKAQEGNLRPNLQLANFVEIAKKFRPLGGDGAEAKDGGMCEKHREPLQFFCRHDGAPLCVVCSRSKEHEGHVVVPLEEASQGNRAFVAAGKGRICQKHQEPMKLFCKDDKVLICLVCDRSKEHRGHKTLPLEEASQEYKDEFFSCLAILKEEREQILRFMEDAETRSQDLLKQTEEEKQEAVVKFRELHTFLEEKEKRLLAQMEGLEKVVAGRRDRHLARLSEELCSLESLIREMEEKSQQPASDLLQDAQSTLQRYEEKKLLENPVIFPLALTCVIRNFGDINHSLESVMKELKDTLDSGHNPQKDAQDFGLNFQKENVTLDPDTAHFNLVLSEDQKSMTRGGKAPALPSNPERFYPFGVVLGREGFQTGCHFWEVLVESEGTWAVGVARRSVRRKGVFPFCPEEGIWAVGKWGSRYQAFVKDHCPPLTLSGELRRIIVCLNCSGDKVFFLDADKGAFLYAFSGTSSSGETLLPFFFMHSKGYLKISS